MGNLQPIQAVQCACSRSCAHAAKSPAKLTQNTQAGEWSVAAAAFDLEKYGFHRKLVKLPRLALELKLEFMLLRNVSLRSS